MHEGIVEYIYATSDDFGQQETIIQSVIYMASTAVLFWFGDRAMRQKVGDRQVDFLSI